MRDVHWALDEVARRIGAPPEAVSLVIHWEAAPRFSAARPEVRASVALAPWVYSSDVPAGIDGRRILIVHGSRDRIASPARSAALALAQKLARRADVDYVTVLGGPHAMFEATPGLRGPRCSVCRYGASGRARRRRSGWIRRRAALG